VKILTAMSGGVDSSVAAFLLQERGHEIVGAMMKLFSDENITDILQNASEAAASRACCTLSDADDARAIANALGIPFYVFNFTETFAATVMERFVQAYRCGTTPNPCIDCNRFLKFEKFLQRARELECGGIATGHYARITQEPSGRYLLKTGRDITKDQSYVLYTMTQEQLAHTFFPLGELEKDEVREIAAAQNFITAKKRDSQDICFAPDGNYAAFINRHTGEPPQTGKFVDTAGKILGEHRGIIHYTVGQRKGLGISAKAPLFVQKINAEENTVILASSEELFTNSLTARDINLIALPQISGKMQVQAKIRYAHSPTPATVFQTAPDQFRIEFPSPQRAITPGQAVVLYDGEIVIGGGTIFV
jgi:tRNA-specific 2-thiouridylase